MPTSPRTALLVGAALALAACGSESPDRVQPAATPAPDGLDAAGENTASGPTTTSLGSTAVTSTPPPEVTSDAIVVLDARGEEVRIESTERIVPLDGDLAEIVFALGLGDQVVATDLSATFPPEADAKPEIGYQRALAAEPILSTEPTVLLATDIAGPPETLDDLERLGIPLVMIPTPASPDGPGAKIRAVAEALGVGAEGTALADEVDAGIAEVIADVPRDDEGPLVAGLYLRGESAQLVLGTDTSLGWMLDAVGARNVATELGVTETRPINIEALVALGPEVIVTTASGLASVGGLDGLLALPGFAETPAGRDGRIVAFDDQYLLGNGPRTPDVLAELAATIRPTEPDAGTGAPSTQTSTPDQAEGAE